MNDTRVSTRTPVLTGDVMALIAGFGLALALFQVQPGPHDFTLKGWPNRPGWWDRHRGVSTFLWYLLLGPTVAGPVIIWRHRKTLTQWSLFSARSLWLCLATTTGYVALSYADGVGGDFWGAIMEIVNPFAIPIAVSFLLVKGA